MSHALTLTNEALQFEGFPESLSAPDYTVSGSATYTKNGRAITAYDLRVDTGPRTKRCFVLMPPSISMVRPMLGVAFPGSNGAGQGAADLLSGNVLDQDEWPLQIAADHNVPMVAIDLPNFGPVPAYGGFPTEMLGPLSDNLYAIQAARHYIETSRLSGARFASLRPEMFVGGLSWGAYMTFFTAMACRNFRWAYVGSACASRLQDNRAHFNPPEMPAEIDYVDAVATASAWCNVRWMFGGDGIGGNAADYLHAPFTDGNSANPTMTWDPGGVSGGPRIVPNTAYILAEMDTIGPNVTTHVNQTLGHQLDHPDVKGWFKPFQPNTLKRWRLAS